jgi:N-methylhydantoinase A
MTVTDVRHDFVRAAPFLSSTLVPQTLESIFSDLEAEGAARLRDGGFTQAEIRFERSVDARYPGQVHELTVPVPRHRRTLEDGAIDELRRIFHDEHRRQFNYDRPDLEIEFLHWRVGAIGSTPSREYSDGTVTAADASGALIGTREIYLAPTGTMEAVSVYQAETLGEGAVVNGPAVIAGETTTILVGPGDLLSCGADGFELRVAVAATTVA